MLHTVDHEPGKNNATWTVMKGNTGSTITRFNMSTLRGTNILYIYIPLKGTWEDDGLRNSIVGICDPSQVFLNKHFLSFFLGLIKMIKQHLLTYEFTVNKYASLIFQNFVLVALQPTCLVVCLDLSSARTLFHRLIMTCYVLQDDVTPNVALCFQYFQL